MNNSSLCKKLFIYLFVSSIILALCTWIYCVYNNIPVNQILQVFNDEKQNEMYNKQIEIEMYDDYMFYTKNNN